MNANLRAYLLLGAVFLLGSLTGAGAMYAYGRRNVHGHFGEGRGGWNHVERRVNAMSRQLKLSPEQTTKLSSILERQREPRAKLMHETMERCGEPLRKLRQSTDGEIRGILTEEQQMQFDELLKARDRRLANP